MAEWGGKDSVKTGTSSDGMWRENSGCQERKAGVLSFIHLSIHSFCSLYPAWRGVLQTCTPESARSEWRGPQHAARNIPLDVWLRYGRVYVCGPLT